MKMWNEAQTSANAAIPSSGTAVTNSNRKACFGQDGGDLGAGKETDFFLIKATQTVTKHSWSSQSSYKIWKKIENYVTDTNESDIGFKKRMKQKCDAEDNKNKVGISSSFQHFSLLKI